MSKEDKQHIQFLKALEALTDRHGCFTSATPVAQSKMRSLVADFVAEITKKK